MMKISSSIWFFKMPLAFKKYLAQKRDFLIIIIFKGKIWPVGTLCWVLALLKSIQIDPNGTQQKQLKKLLQFTKKAQGIYGAEDRIKCHHQQDTELWQFFSPFITWAVHLVLLNAQFQMWRQALSLTRWGRHDGNCIKGTEIQFFPFLKLSQGYFI